MQPICYSLVALLLPSMTFFGREEGEIISSQTQKQRGKPRKQLVFSNSNERLAAFTHSGWKSLQIVAFLLVKNRETFTNSSSIQIKGILVNCKWDFFWTFCKHFVLQNRKRGKWDDFLTHLLLDMYFCFPIHPLVSPLVCFCKLVRTAANESGTANTLHT